MKTKKAIIYTRVSTRDQSIEVQEKELLRYALKKEYKIIKIIKEKASGAKNIRKGLSELFKLASRGKIDLVIVWKLDRFARSLSQLISNLQKLDDLGVEFVSLNDQIDFSTPSGKLMLHLLGAFAEFERNLIVSRVKAGLDNAKSKGKILGRPSKINLDQALELKDEGKSNSEIGRIMGVDRSTISKALKRCEKTPLKTKKISESK